MDVEGITERGAKEEAGSEETEETDDSESEAFEDAMEKLNISA